MGDEWAANTSSPLVSFLILPIVGSRFYEIAADAAAAAYFAFYYSLMAWSYLSLSSSYFFCRWASASFFAANASVFYGLFEEDYAGLACIDGYCYGPLTAPRACCAYLDFLANDPGVSCCNPIPSSSSLGLCASWWGFNGLLVTLPYIFTGLLWVFAPSDVNYGFDYGPGALDGYFLGDLLAYSYKEI